MNETLRIDEIIQILKVSPSFVRTRLQTIDLDWKLSNCGKKNRKIYSCDSEKLFRHIADTIQVFYYDRSLMDYNAKKRPPLELITTPEDLKDEIISGNFDFNNIEDIMYKMNYSSRESVYQFIYKSGTHLIKFHDKTYFRIKF